MHAMHFQFPIHKQTRNHVHVPPCEGAIIYVQYKVVYTLELSLQLLPHVGFVVENYN